MVDIYLTRVLKQIITFPDLVVKCPFSVHNFYFGETNPLFGNGQIEKMKLLNLKITF